MAMGGFSDPARHRLWPDAVASEGSSKETRMPEDVGMLSVVPIGMLILGGIVAAIVVAVFATVIFRGVGLWRCNKCFACRDHHGSSRHEARRGARRHRGERRADRIFRDV